MKRLINYDIRIEAKYAHSIEVKAKNKKEAIKKAKARLIKRLIKPQNLDIDGYKIDF